MIVVEAPSTDTIKNRFDRHCRERNLLFDVPMCMHYLHNIAKIKEEIIFDRFAMIDNVVARGQHYGGEYLVEDF